MNFYIDFEATQFSNSIISIGCVAETGEKFTTLVRPVTGKVNTFITELTGITPEMAENAPSASEAFLDLFNFIEKYNDNEIPKYFCYGDADKIFLEHTSKYMTDLRSMCFVRSVIYDLIDYSQFVKSYFELNNVLGLRRAYVLTQDVEIEQKHDALEDAIMLQRVALSLNSKLVSKEKKEKLKDIPSNSNKPKRKRAPEIFISWGNIKDRYSANTNADKDNWKIKASSEEGIKYFSDETVAALWLIRYHVKGSPKDQNYVNAIIKRIDNTIKNKNQYCKYCWERRK